jgi:creatinine amidohydrolase
VTDLLPTTTTKDERERDAKVALLRIGSFEQHGDYLPLTTDTIVACSIANEIAKSRNVMVLPPITISCSHEHAKWRGTVSIGSQTLHRMLIEIADYLLAAEVEHVVLVNGHGGNYVLGNVVQEYTAVHGAVMSLFPHGAHWKTARTKAGMETDGHTDMHAGELETSVLLAVAPKLVREGYTRADWVADDRPHLLSLGITAYTTTGVIGKPSLGTAEKGNRFLAELASLFEVPARLGG